MLFTASVVGAFLLAILYVLYAARERLVPLLPIRLQSFVRNYAPLASFEDAVSGGYSSGNFDLAGNVEDGDRRGGLDDAGLAEVRRLMDRHRLTFDEARLRRQQNIFRANGIDPDTGLPLDKKAITHL